MKPYDLYHLPRADVLDFTVIEHNLRCPPVRIAADFEAVVIGIAPLQPMCIHDKGKYHKYQLGD